MKKKNIAILLLLPYVIALLGVITVNLTFKVFPNDIAYIEWEYSDIEAFKLGDARYPLRAVGVTTSNFPLAEGNELVWAVKNSDGDAQPHASIEYDNGSYYLRTHSEGEVYLTCSNAKGNITRRTTVIIYKNSVIFARTKIQSSQNNIENTLYYGEYDLKNGKKVGASVDLEIVCLPEGIRQTMKVASQTSNIKLDPEGGKLSILKEGHAEFTVTAGLEEDDTKTSYTYRFEVVDNGVNVYTYDDLLNCTNRSQNGEIVVLRKSFESLQNTYVMSDRGEVVTQNGQPIKRANNIELFGRYENYNAKTGDFFFAKDVYQFETTYNRSYIDQWNAFVKEKNDFNYRAVTDMVNVGLHVQKDFYGNGYTLNLHNLTFPYAETPTSDGYVFYGLSDANLFRGPLPFYCLGKPNNMPIITAYGQDNIGMYVEGDGIQINDINLKNCDIGDTFSNLQYVGTVMEILGDNVTVSNSVLQNGKHVVRAFSSQNTVIDNCLLQNALNFLLVAGSNEYIPVDGDKSFTFTDHEGATQTMTLNEFLNSDGGMGDNMLNTYLIGEYDIAKMKAGLHALQDALNGGAESLRYGGSMEVRDTLFYRSGISSICMESSFNGPFLYTESPSVITTFFSLFEESSFCAIPLTPTKVSGISYPVDLHVTGSTKFYDYKTSEEMDFGGLINENISVFAQDFLEKNPIGSDDKQNQAPQVTIDDIFPLKSMLYADAAKKGSIYSHNGESYLNVAVAFYGGGLNLSTVRFDGLEHAENLNAEFSVDWADSYLSQQTVIDPSNPLESLSGIRGMLQKMVTVVTGVEPFRFVCMKGNGYLYGETPQVSDLRDHNQG